MIYLCLSLSDTDKLMFIVRHPYYNYDTHYSLSILIYAIHKKEV